MEALKRNRVSDVCSFVCSLFPKSAFYIFIVIHKTWFAFQIKIEINIFYHYDKECVKIETKAMIRNRYNYLTLSVQDTKQKEGRSLSNGTTIKKIQEGSQKDRLFPNKFAQTAIRNNNFTRTYMQRHKTTTIINHSRSTALDRLV